MESTCVDTSLNLNVSPSRDMDVVAAEFLVEELNRLSSENKRLTETLIKMSENYNVLEKHLRQLMNTNSEKDATVNQSRKRKAESENCINNRLGFSECSTITEEESFKKPKDSTTAKVSRVLVRTEPSDTSLYVRDGYQWRKYGQKVTRDNPSPRAYFKCSFAPSCPVKKKVQRSVEDPTVLVATYEGEHNHVHHQAELSLLSSEGEAFGSIPVSSPTNRSETVDLVRPGLVDNAHKSMKQFLVQQMATSLTTDPNFTAALATAISGRILDHSSKEKW